MPPSPGETHPVLSARLLSCLFSPPTVFQAAVACCDPLPSRVPGCCPCPSACRASAGFSQPDERFSCPLFYSQRTLAKPKAHPKGTAVAHVYSLQVQEGHVRRGDILLGGILPLTPKELSFFHCFSQGSQESSKGKSWLPQAFFTRNHRKWRWKRPQASLGNCSEWAVNHYEAAYK